ncbi:MAG: helix-turn-helix transcriptional regulator [Eubacterium sp.]|nr:helix-turn-helix transcriptional regulator [Eubacterium sp.]
MEQMVFKNRIKEKRQSLKISQQELANTVGVSRQTIISIENGSFSPTAKLAYLLCLALDTSFEELFYFEMEGEKVSENVILPLIT